MVVEAFTLHSDMVSPAKWGNMQTSTTNKIIINMIAKFHYCLDTNEHNGGGGGGHFYLPHKDYGGRVKGGGGGRLMKTHLPIPSSCLATCLESGHSLALKALHSLMVSSSVV